MIADIFLFGLGLAAGSCVAAYWLYRALRAEADLRDAQARADSLRDACRREHEECERLVASIDGQDVRSYFPRATLAGGRRG
jgi:hypothetical protein